MKIKDFMQGIFTPVLAPIIKSRFEALAIAIAALLHIVLTYADLPAWQCPIKGATGIPCPGCYLGTAISLLLKGKWEQAFAVHAFAPIFLIILAFIGITSLLPDSMRQTLSQKIASVEQHTGATAILLFAFVFYWSLRLFWFGFG
jgi:hypothetical protein